MLARLFWILMAMTGILGSQSEELVYKKFKMPACAVSNLLNSMTVGIKSFRACRYVANENAVPAFSWASYQGNSYCFLMADFKMAGTCRDSTIGDDVYVLESLVNEDTHVEEKCGNFHYKCLGQSEVKYFDATYLRSLSEEVTGNMHLKTFATDSAVSCTDLWRTSVFTGDSCLSVAGFLDTETCTSVGAARSQNSIITSITNKVSFVHESSFMELCGKEISGAEFTENRLGIMSHRGFGCRDIPTPESDQTCSVTLNLEDAADSSKFEVSFYTGMYLSKSGCEGDHLEIVSNPGTESESANVICTLQPTMQYSGNKLQFNLKLHSGTEKGLGFFLHVLRVE